MIRRVETALRETPRGSYASGAITGSPAFPAEIGSLSGPGDGAESVRERGRTDGLISAGGEAETGMRNQKSPSRSSCGKGA